jgi:hypothetical protein
MSGLGPSATYPNDRVHMSPRQAERPCGSTPACEESVAPARQTERFKWPLRENYCVNALTFTH